MQLTDTHAHLTFEGLADNVEQVVSRATDGGVEKIITVGTEISDFANVEALGKKFSNVWTAYGIHPHYAKDASDDDVEKVKKYCLDDKAVAIGETGLDYHYNFSKQQSQKDLFRSHLNIAAAVKKPVIVHSRNAFEDTLEILNDYKSRLDKIVFHCFGGDAEQAKILIDRGYYISYTGVITFKNANTARQGALEVPLEKMMLETDCPYMSPEPKRGQKINEPALMVHTAEYLAKLKGIDFVKFCEQIAQTTKTFFGI